MVGEDAHTGAGPSMVSRDPPNFNASVEVNRYNVRTKRPYPTVASADAPQSVAQYSGRAHRKRARHSVGAGTTASVALLAVTNGPATMLEVVGNIGESGALWQANAAMGLGYDISSNNTSPITSLENARNITTEAPGPVADTNFEHNSQSPLHVASLTDHTVVDEGDERGDTGHEHSPTDDTRNGSSSARDHVAVEGITLHDMELMTGGGASGVASASTTTLDLVTDLRKQLDLHITVPDPRWTMDQNAGLSHMRFAEVFEVILPTQAAPLVLTPIAEGNHGNTMSKVRHRPAAVPWDGTGAASILD